MTYIDIILSVSYYPIFNLFISKMKKSILFTLIAFLSVMSAYAADKIQIGDLYYYLDTSAKTATVTSHPVGRYSGDITIPSTISYDNAAYSVTSIGGDAFYMCTGLTSITIPNSVTSIGGIAFQYCSSLTSITIPESVTSIGNFYGCMGLTSVVWNAKKCGGWRASSTSPFYSIRNNITSFTLGNAVDSIPTGLCSGMSNLTSITIPNSVTSIGDAAFSGCTGLTSITIPNNVTSIGASAFLKCTGLTSITIPNSVTLVGWNAFDGCTGLTSVVWNAKIWDAKVYGDWNYYYYGFSPFGTACENITIFTFGNDVDSIPAYFFSKNMVNLASITIGNNVTSIGEGAFSGCTGITSVVWNARKCHFDYLQESSTIFLFNSSCKKITSFTFGNEVDCIPEGLCSGMSNLTSITIPNSVTSIGNYAFDGCTGLTSITIPNSVTSIGNFAFDGCTGLTSITIPNSVTSIGNFAFDGCTGLTSVTIGNSVTSIGYAAFWGCTGLTSITIPNSVTSIGNSAFSGCTGLTSITIPNSVTSIEWWTFQNCTGLTSITIPNSVTSIGNYAFSGCTGLTSIQVEAQKPPQCGDDSCFNNVLKDIPVQVPCGTKEAYQTSAGWSLFTNIIEEHDYAISVQSSNEDYGTATIVSYTCDNELTIQAIANEHYHFTRWSDGNTDNPRIITLEDDVIYTAEFAIDQYAIAVSCAPQQGTVTGGGTYAYGTHITLIAAANKGYEFTQWSNGVTNNPYLFTVTEDINIEAQFISTTAVVNTSIDTADNATPQKIILNGQVYILRGGKTYTPTGVEVQ